MNTPKRESPDSEDVLRLIHELSAEAEHTDAQSREALEAAGIDPDRFVRAVRSQVQPARIPTRGAWMSWEALRSCALAATAVSAVLFVVLFNLNQRAGVEAQRQSTRARFISPLLPALASEDPEQRSLALAVAQQVDPAFAAETSQQLARWEVSTQAQARASRNAAYANRILTGLQKLELSRDPGDRKVAIWNDLLPVLLEARRNRDDFFDVAIAYQRVLPLLRVGNPEVFLDSYWGELWILSILLDSKIVPVVDAARLQAPSPAVVQEIFDRNASTLPDRDRKAFQEAVAVYQNTLKGLR
jgi:hypothetical protein